MNIYNALFYIWAQCVISSAIVWQSAPGDVCVFVGDAAHLRWSYTHTTVDISALNFFHGSSNPRTLVLVKPLGGAAHALQDYRQRAQFTGTDSSPGISLSNVTAADEGVYSLTLSGLAEADNRTNTDCHLKVEPGGSPRVRIPEAHTREQVFDVLTDTTYELLIEYKHNYPANVSLTTGDYTEGQPMCRSPCTFKGLQWKKDSSVHVTMSYPSLCSRYISKNISTNNVFTTMNGYITTTPRVEVSKGHAHIVLAVVITSGIVVVTVIVIVVIIRRRTKAKQNSEGKKDAYKTDGDDSVPTANTPSEILLPLTTSRSTSEGNEDESDISGINPEDPTTPENKSTSLSEE